MTEPMMEFSDGPDTAPALDVVARRRGRPRSQETIDRDQRVLAALGSDVKSKEQLVEELQLEPSIVYLSLWRLRKEHRVERVSDSETRHAWRVIHDH